MVGLALSHEKSFKYFTVLFSLIRKKCATPTIAHRYNIMVCACIPVVLQSCLVWNNNMELVNLMVRLWWIYLLIHAVSSQESKDCECHLYQLGLLMSPNSNV